MLKKREKFRIATKIFDVLKIFEEKGLNFVVLPNWPLGGPQSSPRLIILIVMLLYAAGRKLISPTFSFTSGRRIIICF